MNSKSLAIVCNDLNIGGVETALINMLNAIDVQRYKISLFTNKTGNECLSRLPNHIKVYDLDEMSLKMSFWKEINKFHVVKAAKILWNYALARMSKSEFSRLIYSTKTGFLSEEFFDCAIAYKQTIAMTKTLNQIHAKKKIVWVHGALLGGDNPEKQYLESLLQFNRIVCVSNSVRENVLRVCPKAKDRIEVLYNLIDKNDILRKANEAVVEEFCKENINLVTVGRLSTEKGQIMIPQVARLLCDAGYKIKWYLIGEGEARSQIEFEVRRNDVASSVILLGARLNPYPYIKQCDIYVQTSLSEGWCLTVQEAKILQRPIVVTDLAVMREQITNMGNGLISQGIAPGTLFENISLLIDNPFLQKKFISNLSTEAHDTAAELEKIYEIIDEELPENVIERREEKSFATFC